MHRTVFRLLIRRLHSRLDLQAVSSARIIRPSHKLEEGRGRGAYVCSLAACSVESQQATPPQRQRVPQRQPAQNTCCKCARGREGPGTKTAEGDEEGEEQRGQVWVERGHLKAAEEGEGGRERGKRGKSSLSGDEKCWGR
jgi:hypothetical protein